MRKILITLFFVLPIFVNAQDVSGILFSGKSVDYFGQLTDKGKNKDGLGIQRLKGGNLFAGNLRKNKFHGFGMMIAGENGEITNCDGAYVYVGEWKYGVKNGKGIVYGRNGTAIYVGMFVNPAKRNVLDLKNETCKNREKRNVLKISRTRHFKTTKKQSRTGCFYSF